MNRKSYSAPKTVSVRVNTQRLCDSSYQLYGNGSLSDYEEGGEF